MPSLLQVTVPDIGDFKDVAVIEVLVKPGSSVNKDDSLVTLESDKATMDVPSPQTGTINEVNVNVGDKVSEGSLILSLEVEESAPEAPAEAQPAEERGVEATQAAPQPARAPTPIRAASPPAPLPSHRAPPVAADMEWAAETLAHASPKIRRFARELGVALEEVDGSGPQGRILKEDVQEYVRDVLGSRGGTAPAALAPEIPEVDFEKFGPVEPRPFSPARTIAASKLHRNWLVVPQATHWDEADVTDLEAFRTQMAGQGKKEGVHVALLAFVLKAAGAALRRFPEFNASLNRRGDGLVLKRYYHIGVGVDTPDGPAFPVVRDVDRKGVFELAAELETLSAKGRENRLSPPELQGGSFSISNLSDTCGTAFTPIVNALEVAILGLSRPISKPVACDGQVLVRLMLPLSLSYDARVIAQASAARFSEFLGTLLSDARRLVL